MKKRTQNKIIEIPIPILKNNTNKNLFAKELDKAKELMLSGQELFVIINRGPPTQKDLGKPIKVFYILYPSIE